MNNSDMKAGHRYICTGSASCAYKVGREYLAVVKPDYTIGLIGDDGLWDDRRKLVSQFKEKT